MHRVVRTPPQLLADPAESANWGVWQYHYCGEFYGQASTLQSQSISRFNWYPINFYDDREGEIRDNA